MIRLASSAVPQRQDHAAAGGMHILAAARGQLGVLFCRDAVRPGRLSVYPFGFPRAGLPCVGIGAPRTVLVAVPAEALAEVGVEASALHAPQGGPCRSRSGAFVGIAGHGIE